MQTRVEPLKGTAAMVLLFIVNVFKTKYINEQLKVGLLRTMWIPIGQILT